MKHYTKVREGDACNYMSCEYFVDKDEYKDEIPLSELKPYTRLFALNEGNPAIWMCDSEKHWFKLN